MSNLCLLLSSFTCCLLLLASGTFANILLIDENNTTFSFNTISAKFGLAIEEAGEQGTVFLASPLDACSPLIIDKDFVKESVNSPFLLIMRGGGCGFVDKVKRAQAAGFKAAIIYNNDDSNLVSMSGDSSGIHIHAVFISKRSGLKLQSYIGVNNIEIWLTKNEETSMWSIVAIAFLALLALSGMLAICFFVRSNRMSTGRERPRAPLVRGMSSRLVKAMPSLLFTEALEDNCTSETCAICLDDYNVGEKIRILPCCHKFHSICVDAWLTTWRTFCPICKRDVKASITSPPASERTPLLAVSASPSSSTSLVSFVRSSPHTSSRPMQISRSSSPHTSSYIHRSNSNTPASHTRNASSSYRSQASRLNNSLTNSHASRNSLYTSLSSSASSYVRRPSNQPVHMFSPL